MFKYDIIRKKKIIINSIFKEAEEIGYRIIEVGWDNGLHKYIFYPTHQHTREMCNFEDYLQSISNNEFIIAELANIIIDDIVIFFELA